MGTINLFQKVIWRSQPKSVAHWGFKVRSVQLQDFGSLLLHHDGQGAGRRENIIHLGIYCTQLSSPAYKVREKRRREESMFRFIISMDAECNFWSQPEFQRNMTLCSFVWCLNDTGKQAKLGQKWPQRTAWRVNKNTPLNLLCFCSIITLFVKPQHTNAT